MTTKNTKKEEMKFIGLICKYTVIFLSGSPSPPDYYTDPNCRKIFTCLP